MDRLLAHLGQQIPQRQVDAGDGVEHNPLAPVEQRRAEHLVPDLFDVGDLCPFNEAG